jgi:ribonuclease BN (tRNA processing enzyme)
MAFMCRSINPVGQGAFYTESFLGEKEIHVVYDCGSLTSPKLIKSTIERVFKKDEEIAAVFISHFDEDHINGLKFLLNYCNVKYLFLPLMQKDDKALLLIHFMTIGIEFDSFLYSFVEAPERIIDETRTQIVYVGESEGENRSESEQEDFYLDRESSNHSGTQKISSGTKCKILNREWVYIPYNFKAREHQNMLIEEFNKKSIPIPKSPSEAHMTYRQHAGELKKIYKSLPNGRNGNSMVVYSGPTLGFENLYYLTNQYSCCKNSNFKFCYQYHYINCRVGCLYTGDSNLSDLSKCDMLEKYFQQYWEHIGTWQIPHHGSILNYNTKLSKNTYISSAFISAGLNNTNKHPHESVVRSLLANDINVFIVTENRESQIRYIINMK